MLCITRWQTSGRQLDIAEKYHNDPLRCLVEMFEIWFEQIHPPPTWPNVIAAVEFLGVSLEREVHSELVLTPKFDHYQLNYHSALCACTGKIKSMH